MSRIDASTRGCISKLQQTPSIADCFKPICLNRSMFRSVIEHFTKNGTVGMWNHPIIHFSSKSLLYELSSLYPYIKMHLPRLFETHSFRQFGHLTVNALLAVAKWKIHPSLNMSTCCVSFVCFSTKIAEVTGQLSSHEWASRASAFHQFSSGHKLSPVNLMTVTLEPQCF